MGLKDIEWKHLLKLKAHQNSAIDEAIQHACANPELYSALERDFQSLVSGECRISVSEEGRALMYGNRLFRMHAVLILLMRLPWLIERYQEHRIPEKYLIDTLSDVGIWMDVCEKKTGFPGLLEYGWLSNHFSFRLFRIGRLQFIAQESRVPAYVFRHTKSGVVMAVQANTAIDSADGIIYGHPIHRSGYAGSEPVKLDSTEWTCVLKPGDSVLDMHIAEGCPLDPDEVIRSLNEAPDFFEKYLSIQEIKALTCSSWLLDDNIAQMQPGGNIAKFQQNFYLVPKPNASDWQTKQRVFGNPEVSILDAECHTSLQKAIAAWYRMGKSCRDAAGFILL